MCTHTHSVLYSYHTQEYSLLYMNTVRRQRRGKISPTKSVTYWKGPPVRPVSSPSILLVTGSQSSTLTYTLTEREQHRVTVHCSPLVAFSCPPLLNRLPVSPCQPPGGLHRLTKQMKQRQQVTEGCMRDTDRVWEKDRQRNMPIGKVIYTVWLTLKESACFVSLFKMFKLSICSTAFTAYIWL